MLNSIVVFFKSYQFLKAEYDQEIPQSHTTDQPSAHNYRIQYKAVCCFSICISVFDVYPQFTNCKMALGVGSNVIITGECPSASSLHQCSDYDGIEGLQTMSNTRLHTAECTFDR